MGFRYSELFADQDLGNRDPAFSGNRIEQIHPSVFFEDGRIAQLIYLTVGGAAHRRNERLRLRLPNSCSGRRISVGALAFQPYQSPVRSIWLGNRSGASPTWVQNTHSWPLRFITAEWRMLGLNKVDRRQGGRRHRRSRRDHERDQLNVGAGRGGTAFFPPGTYLISQGLNVNFSNVVLMGASPFVSTIKLGSSPTIVIDMQTNPISNVGVVNLGIDGNKANQADPSGGIGIAMWKVTRAFVRNCYIHDTTRSGIVVGLPGDPVPCVDVDLTGNPITDCGSAGAGDQDKSGYAR